MTCKDCIHENLCVIKAFPSAFENTHWEKEQCDHFKDKTRYIEFPCKVGDTVYRISKRYGEWCVLPRMVCSIRYSLDSRGNIAWYLFTTIEDRIGKTVFLTREEAGNALKERLANEKL